MSDVPFPARSRELFHVLLLTAFAWLGTAPCALAADAERPPSPVPAPTNERCLGCHDDDTLQNDAGASLTVHASDLAGGAHANVPCATCHTSAESVKHPRNKLGPVDLAACKSCHAADIAALPLSVHGGSADDPVTPQTCTNCHEEAHVVRNRARSDSAVHPNNQTDTCGSCHKVAKRKFQQSAHAAALKKGDQAPSCSSCHTAHSVQPVADTAWRLKVSNDACGECHESRGESFRDNFHGQMAHLQFGGAAVCADCHRAHDILPASNPQSSVAPAHLVETCGRCHKDANENFVKYRPHANPHHRAPGTPALAEESILWGTMLFMKILIIGVFAFFGAHSILWLVRSVIERNRK